MHSRFTLALLVLALTTAAAFLIPLGESDAVPNTRWDLGYVCYHNGSPYTIIPTLPGGGAPPCPEDPELWNPTWDEQEGIDCRGQEEIGVCLKERHIDCEFTSEPGGI